MWLSSTNDLFISKGNNITTTTIVWIEWHTRNRKKVNLYLSKQYKKNWFIIITNQKKKQTTLTYCHLVLKLLRLFSSYAEAAIHISQSVVYSLEKNQQDKCLFANYAKMCSQIRFMPCYLMHQSANVVLLYTI